MKQLMTWLTATEARMRLRSVQRLRDRLYAAVDGLLIDAEEAQARGDLERAHALLDAHARFYDEFPRKRCAPPRVVVIS